MGAGDFPYAFHSSGRPEREFGRVLKRISRRLAALRRRGGADRTGAVHEIRTLIKLLRALLWLARPALPPATAAYAKIELHNAARLLSAGRDLVAKQTVLEALARDHKPGPKSEAIDRAGHLLLRHAPRLKEPALLRQQARAVALVRKTIPHLVHAAAGDTRWKKPRKRLEKALGLAARAQLIARHQPTPPHLHEWRKKVKRVFYLLQILHPNPKRKIRRAIQSVNQLQERLGDHHDTVLVEDFFTRHRADIASDPALDPLFDLLDRRKRKLHKKAGKTARKL